MHEVEDTERGNKVGHKPIFFITYTVNYVAKSLLRSKTNITL